jgi:hypothetical protein
MHFFNINLVSLYFVEIRVVCRINFDKNRLIKLKLRIWRKQGREISNRKGAVEPSVRVEEGKKNRREMYPLYALFVEPKVQFRG